jgi:predicted dehydrogenase
MPKRQIRYAVVGLGHIAQVAVLPAFGNARRNSRLVALVSGDPVKREQLGKKYDVQHTYSYEQYDECLKSDIDAVYIALPNTLHCEFAERAARAGKHVLVEKPMAVTEEECERMTRAARDAGVKLMVAYRLHFERANLEAGEVARSGRIGEPRLFNSTFCTPVVPGNIRVRRDTGGGVLYDIGIYCINAARYLFQDEPVEVTAQMANSGDPRFRETEEMVAATLRFPGDRLATFTCSFGAADIATYHVVGTRGDLELNPAYEYAAEIRQRVTVNGRTRERTFPKRDQFAPELVSFSECVLNGAEPEPSGREGLADVRVIRAIYASAEAGGRAVRLAPFQKEIRPTLDQEVRRPPVRQPSLVNTEAPSRS